ncbi:hypothetical protein ACFX2G_043945 [Malus domestica]
MEGNSKSTTNGNSYVQISGSNDENYDVAPPRQSTRLTTIRGVTLPPRSTTTMAATTTVVVVENGTSPWQLGYEATTAAAHGVAAHRVTTKRQAHRAAP